MLGLDGSVVETMVQEGRKIVQDAIEEFKPLVVLAAFSGGNDSIVSTHFAVTEFNATVLHCNTGTGLKRTAEHVHSTAARFGWDFVETFAKPSGKPAMLDESILPSGKWIDGETAYEEFVLNHGFPGPIQHQRMFQRLKERPLAKHVREIRKPHSKDGPVMIVSGIRHDESAIRAGYKRAVQKEPKNPRVWVNPFYWRSAVDFEHYRQEFGLPRNPVKGRIGISGECNCGAFASSNPGELEAIRSVEPEMAAYLDDLSRRVRHNGFPWGWGETMPAWWKDARKGQLFLFDSHHQDEQFTPMCVGCPMGRR